MPSAADYREAASRLRRTGEHIAREAVVHRSSTAPAAIAGGPVRIALGSALADVHEHLVRAAGECGQLAIECDRRAEATESVLRLATGVWPWGTRS